MKRATSILSLLLSALTAGCGLSDETPPGALDFDSVVPLPLMVMNQSQYPVLDIYVHQSSSFSGAPNLLDAVELPLDGELMLENVRGVDFLTYVRTERDLGDRYSITTDTPLGINRDGFALLIFDEGFRLLFPEHPENPVARGL